VLNLALFLGARTQGVALDRIRQEVYPSGQSQAAFERMFSRDKDLLSQAGLRISSTSQGHYQLITTGPAGSFCDPLPLSNAERAAIALAGFALLQEPLFPLPFALRLALTKLSGLLDDKGDAAPVLKKLPASASLAEPDASGYPQGMTPELVLRAITERRLIQFSYTNNRRITAKRQVAPYGLFLLSGRFYFVGLDKTSGEQRTFRLTRMKATQISEETFHPPSNFRTQDWICLPFEIAKIPKTSKATATNSAQTCRSAPPKHKAQHKAQEAEKEGEYVQTSLIIPAERAAHTATLTRGRGKIAPRADGDLDWHIGYRDQDALLTFVLEENLRFGSGAARERAALRSALAALAQGDEQ
jgi:proteasome accessory factor B